MEEEIVLEAIKKIYVGDDVVPVIVPKMSGYNYGGDVFWPDLGTQWIAAEFRPTHLRLYDSRNVIALSPSILPQLLEIFEYWKDKHKSWEGKRTICGYRHHVLFYHPPNNDEGIRVYREDDLTRRELELRVKELERNHREKKSIGDLAIGLDRFSISLSYQNASNHQNGSSEENRKNDPKGRITLSEEWTVHSTLVCSNVCVAEAMIKLYRRLRQQK